MRYDELRPASRSASKAARASSKKANTKPELILRAAVRSKGLRSYRIGPSSLPGKPDLAFVKERVAVFCDGDFWHGRNLEDRIAKLERGHNAPYWIAKIRYNVARDRRQALDLETRGWIVIRFWETDVKRDPAAAADAIATALAERR